MDYSKKVVFLIGPTATGKTRLSLGLAEYFPIEIISADSMQVYRGLDIGTAKAAREDQQRLRHHLIDVCEVGEEYNAYDFSRQALEAMSEIWQRNKLALVVGGSGLYIKALTDGLAPNPSAAPHVRRLLKKEAKEKGLAVLYEKLRDIDPKRAAEIDAQDERRIIRALEIYHQSKIAPSVLRSQRESLEERGIHYVMIGVTCSRAELYARTDARVDDMLKEGLINEVKHFKERIAKTAAQAVGYKEIISYMQGTISEEEAVRLVKRNTRHLVKRQLTWFKKDARIHWINYSSKDTYDEVLLKIKEKIEDFLR